MIRMIWNKFPAKIVAFSIITSSASAYACADTGAGAGIFLSFKNPNHPSTTPDRINAILSGIIRSSRAISTIASNVVDYKYSLYGLSDGSEDYSLKLSQVHLRSANRLLLLCESNKGFYIKAAQFLSAMRQLPKEYSSTLSCLQDQALPCHFQAIKQVLLSNLGRDLSDVFVAFDEQPIAAASIAQVHRAILKDNCQVAVKVQYPGLEQHMRVDTATMSFISKSIAWLFPEYRFDWMVEEFAKSIASELDFIQEAMNSERTARNFKNNYVVKVPRVFWEFTTSQVLTMQYFQGHKVDDVEFLEKNKINTVEVVKEVVKVFAEMIFVFGFLHGDLHPGNILVSPEGPKGFSIVLLDHGIYRELDVKFRVDYCRLWKALILSDKKKIQDLGEQFGVGKYSKYFPIMFTGRTLDSKLPLGRGMSIEERRTLKLDLQSLKMEDISSFMESLPPDFLVILKTDGLLRSLINKLGVPQKLRMLAYGKYALHGLSPKMNSESDGTMTVSLSKLRADMNYAQVRLLLEVLELLCWMEERRKALIRRVEKMFISFGQFLTIAKLKSFYSSSELFELNV